MPTIRVRHHVIKAVVLLAHWPSTPRTPQGWQEVYDSWDRDRVLTGRQRLTFWVLFFALTPMGALLYYVMCVRELEASRIL